MMHEEFEKLTGITVSYHYYTENIEPEYAMGDTEKAEFCSQWVKAHKADICKALAPDISGMTREDATIRAKEAEYHRLRQIAEEHQRSKESAEVEAHNLRFEIDRKLEIIEVLESERDRLKEIANELEASHREILTANEKHEKALTEKDQEIMKLKAILFDMMYKTA